MSRGDRIRRRRDELGLSQQIIAEMVGVSRQQVSNWERNEQAPTGDNLVLLALALETTAQWLSTGESEGRGRDTGEVAYDPFPDVEASPAEQLISFLRVRVGMRRLAGELTSKDLVAAAYTLARAERFDADEFKKLDAWRNQILADER